MKFGERSEVKSMKNFQERLGKGWEELGIGAVGEVEWVDHKNIIIILF